MLLPWPKTIDPLAEGITLQVTGDGPVAEKLLVASTQTVMAGGGDGVITGGPYAFTIMVCVSDWHITPGLISISWYTLTVHDVPVVNLIMAES
jgi:uncharacterized membrane protein